MNKNRLIAALFLCLLFPLKNWSQALVCVDILTVSVDENCTATVTPEQVLEVPCTNCPQGLVVEIDRVPSPMPANGPWSSPVLTKDDIGKPNYWVRVRDVATSNSCWGRLEVQDKIKPKLTCQGLNVVNLGSDGTALLNVGDITVTATDNCSSPGEITLKLPGNQTSTTFNCSNLGVNFVQLTATDAGGNTGSCPTTVIVDDPANYCANCVACPPAQEVSFEHGVNVLLPALQSGNLSDFAAYGYANFGAACPGDTAYTVAYHPTNAAYSWFVRRWEAHSNGQLLGACEQIISFPFARTFSISGRVFLDSIANCIPDAPETGVNLFQVAIVKLPGNQETRVLPDADGHYAINVVANGADELIEVRLMLPNGIGSACPTVLAISPTGAQTSFVQDFGLQSLPTCYLNQVTISTDNLRRCFGNNRYYVQYCNLGFDTSPNTTIEVQLDSLVSLISATLPYTTGPDNTYTFALGDLPRFTCGTITLTAQVSCAATLGQTLCAEATIFPHTSCDQTNWAGPYIETSALCDGDSVLLQIRNSGAQDMSTPENYIVVEDIIMRSAGSFMLDAGDSLVLKVPANGATWRVEAGQVDGYPENDNPSAALESCGGLNTPGLINAFPLNDDMLYTDIDCNVVTGSYDPNDKSAVPTGYGPAHIIRENTDLEYKIRFQNTGTDTAFLVVIRDTLSPLLDASSLEAGASSHPYRLDVYEGGILHFVFENILLPDSNVNEAASHGFVKYRIAQKRDLAVGSVIENKAAIYFDFNDPVVTNTVFHTVGGPMVLSATPLHTRAAQVKVQPTPFEHTAVLEISGYTPKEGLLRLYSLDGRLVQQRFFEGNRTQIQRNGLVTGTYFFQITDRGMPVSSGVVQCR